MKKLLLVLLLVSGTALQGTAQEKNSDAAPELTFDAEVLDYGTIPHSSNGTKEFRFKNTGQTPLTLTNVSTSCGCLVAQEWPKEPIAPGKSGVIKVKYDTNRIGSFEKTITVTSNSKTPTKVLRVKGIVKPQ